MLGEGAGGPDPPPPLFLGGKLSGEIKVAGPSLFKIAIMENNGIINRDVRKQAYYTL